MGRVNPAKSRGPCPRIIHARDSTRGFVPTVITKQILDEKQGLANGQPKIQLADSLNEPNARFIDEKLAAQLRDRCLQEHFCRHAAPRIMSRILKSSSHQEKRLRRWRFNRITRIEQKRRMARSARGTCHPEHAKEVST